jgi:hypothetical protein
VSELGVVRGFPCSHSGSDCTPLSAFSLRISVLTLGPGDLPLVTLLPKH